jgi:hypothetical protein
MDLSPQDVSLMSEQGRKAAELKYRTELKDRLNGLRSDVAERPFFYLAIAFAAGLVSNTFPARMLLLIVMRILSWLTGPALLVLGIIKIGNWFSHPRPLQPASGPPWSPGNGQTANMP